MFGARLREDAERYRPGPGPLPIAVTGQIDGQPWTGAVDFHDIADLRRHLVTAALVVIAFSPKAALTVSAFNLGTAIGSWIAGRALDSGMISAGLAVVGTAIAALTLIPSTVVALNRDRRAAASGSAGLPSAPADRADRA